MFFFRRNAPSIKKGPGESESSSEISRRGFLKTASVGGALLVTSTPWAGALDPRRWVVEPEAADSIQPGPEFDLSPRERLLFDFDWKFTQGHATDSALDLGFGDCHYGQDLSTTGDLKFALATFNDETWRSVNLPHDWGVELPFVFDKELPSPYGQEARGFKPLGREFPETSIGWYRRVFDIPESDLGRRIFVDFDGVFQSALVFCNGSFVGRSNSGCVPFRLDLTPFLFYGKRNCITVRVDGSLSEGWYYEGAGIYRHVWLTKVDMFHLGHLETVVRTVVREDAAYLNLSALVENETLEKQRCIIRWRILDAAGQIVATAASSIAEVAAGCKHGLSAEATIRGPKLWSPQTPNLYSAIVALEAAGDVRDMDQVTFGIRTLAFDANQGFFLNGKKLPVQGTCNHQDHAGVGVALPDRLQYYRLGVLTSAGCNAVRTAHHMPTPEWVRACEQSGVLMICETRSMSSSEEGLAQLEAMIKRYRNSPSIFLWSLGNEEVTLQSNEVGSRVIREMQEHAHRLDPSRFCTAAVLGVPLERSFAPELDVMGFNHNLTDPDQYHKAHPMQPSIGTETASTTSTRGIYTTDKSKNWMSAYDANAGAERADDYLAFFASRPWLSGSFIWTGFDYRGEPTPYSWPSISSQFGIVDTCGFPKDNFYYYKAWWSNEPLLHLFPHWNWPGKEGEDILVWVHSNVECVELLCNGQSLGAKKVVPFRHLEWRVKYEPGILEARGMRDGKVVLTAQHETTGNPVKVVLTSDRAQINADGEDLAVLKAETIDRNGRRVPTANNLIRFKVLGGGSLIGVGNGDPNCHESDKGTERSLFSGLAQAIIQSSRNPGSITIRATSEGLEGATFVIETRQVKLRKAVASVLI